MNAAGDVDEMVGHAIMRAARACVGVPFRLHGRDVSTGLHSAGLGAGLDCVGLVVVALCGAGLADAARAAPTGYRLRGGRQAQHEAALRAAGLTSVTDEQPGDIILARAGPAQHHLMVATGSGFIHAHAGLRRVVEMPGPSPWPVLSIWRAYRAEPA